jgi:hypothetical protein
MTGLRPEEVLDVSRGVEHTEHNNGVFHRSVEDEVLFKAFHPPHANILKLGISELPCRSHLRHSGKFVEGSIG